MLSLLKTNGVPQQDIIALDLERTQRTVPAARALAYGEKIEYSSPPFDHATFAEGRAVLRFTYLDGGLLAKDDPLTGVTIAGVDGNLPVGERDHRR